MEPITIALGIAIAAAIGAHRCSKSAEKYGRLAAEENKAIAIRHETELTSRREQEREAEENRKRYATVYEAQHKQDVRIQVNVARLKVILNHAQQLGIADEEILKSTERALRNRIKGDIDNIWKGF